MPSSCRRWRHRPRAAPVATASMAGALLVLASSAQALGPRDRHLTDARHGVSVEAPAGWTLSQHTGYGDTVAVLVHPDGGRITVSASPTTASDGRALFEQNQKGLIAQKLLPSAPQPGPRGFTSVDVAVPGRSDRLRQLYLVRSTALGKQGVILTLVCRDSLFAELTSALGFVAERLELDEPELPASAGNGPRTPGAGGAGPPPAGHATYASALAAPPSDKPIDLSSMGLGGGPATRRPPGAGGSGGQLRPAHRDGHPAP